jgi:Tfp pilus assembly protein PilF
MAWRSRKKECRPVSRLDKIRQMLQADENDVFLNFSLAMEYVKENRLADAISQFDRVIQLDPNHVAAHMQRASVLVSLKRTADARQALEQGIAAAKRAGDSHAAEKMTQALTLLVNFSHFQASS